MEISGKVSSILADQDSITVWSNGPNAMVFDAIQLMDEKNVEALPVLQHGIKAQGSHLKIRVVRFKS
jgi:CBS domain-containing protein